MRIGELGQATGVDIETIRYYEKAGLLPAPARHPNGYRAYAPLHVERLAFIRHCRALDISLADIQRLLAFVAHPESNCRDIDQLIDAQLADVKEKLAKAGKPVKDDYVNQLATLKRINTLFVFAPADAPLATFMPAVRLMRGTLPQVHVFVE